MNSPVGQVCNLPCGAWLGFALRNPLAPRVGILPRETSYRSRKGAAMTRAELLSTHFARCYREYSQLPEAVRARVERLAATAGDPSVPPLVRSDVLAQLVAALFPADVEQD